MALSAALMDTPVKYSQLEDINDDFEQIDLEIIRHQHKLSKDLYAKRQKLVAQIPNFWALVFEQAPTDIDEYIQPSDSALLLTALTDLSVERFELPDGDPRSLLFRFEFSENDHFENKVLEKKFWWRRARDGMDAGYVSEPVEIKWKSAEKDLTGGMLDLVYKNWVEDQAGENKESETKKALVELMEKTPLGSISFFTWFGFRGRKFTAEDDKIGAKAEEELRKKRKAGEDIPEEDDEDLEEDEYEYEVFPTGDDLAVAIAEDLWPGAIQYFIEATAQEDGMSDVDFEESDEDMADGEEAPPLKKVKA